MTRRVSKQGRVYQQSSTGGWGGWPGPRECIVCGVRVKADDPAEMRTEQDGRMWTRHLGCKAAA